MSKLKLKIESGKLSHQARASEQHFWQPFSSPAFIFSLPAHVLRQVVECSAKSQQSYDANMNNSPRNRQDKNKLVFIEFNCIRKVDTWSVPINFRAIPSKLPSHRVQRSILHPGKVWLKWSKRSLKSQTGKSVPQWRPLELQIFRRLLKSSRVARHWAEVTECRLDCYILTRLNMILIRFQLKYNCRALFTTLGVANPARLLIGHLSRWKI